VIFNTCSKKHSRCQQCQTGSKQVTFRGTHVFHMSPTQCMLKQHSSTGTLKAAHNLYALGAQTSHRIN